MFVHVNKAINLFFFYYFSYYRIIDASQKENLGIIVRYKVKVKLILGPLGGDVVAELPFILMHPKPDEPKISETVTNNSKKTEDNSNTNNGHLIQLEYVYTIVFFLDF